MPRKKKIVIVEEIIPGESNEDIASLIWIGAFRYYCGRMTIAVSFFCDALISNWEKIPNRAKFVIHRDLEREFERDDEFRADPTSKYYPLGAVCDRYAWEKVRRLWTDVKLEDYYN